jgi:hypothetical protein
MTNETTPPVTRWSALIMLPNRILTALADSTRDWRRGCGL